MSIVSRVGSGRMHIRRGGGVFSSPMETYGLGLGLRLGVGGRALVFRGPLPGCLLPLHPRPHRFSPLRLRLRRRPLAVKSALSRDDALSLPLADGRVSPFLPSRFLQVVLVSPQIPGNTGCIARTCAASAVALHLVGPLGFLVDDAKLKRAGLDYWPFERVTGKKVISRITSFNRWSPGISYVVVKVHESWAAFRNYFEKQDGQKRLLAFTKRGSKVHSDFSYQKGDWLVFGSETSGLSDEVLVDCRSQMYGGGTIRIPMVETYVRCLNLSVSVGIALYEACRQLNYEQLQPMCGCRDDTESLFITEDIFA